MKKTLSILLTLAMILAMIPMAVLTAGAEDATVTLPTAGWNDAGNYDLSWCTEGTANGADSVQVDGKWYKVLDYITATFEIKDAADLAGISVLSNAVKLDKKISANDAATNKGMRQNPIFANCTFYITADIDLTGKLWTPIAKEFASGNKSGDVGTTVFGGNLIGSKGDAQNGNGGIITIKGMTVNVVARATDPARGQAAGLIGVKGGGGLVGGGKCNIVAENCYVSSDINCETDAGATIYAGGFVGHSLGLGGDMTLSFNNCHFDGTVKSATVIFRLR